MEAKLDWMERNYRSVLQPLGISQSSAAKIVNGAQWEEKLNWVQGHYANSRLRQSDLVKVMVKKDWYNHLQYTTIPKNTFPAILTHY